MSNPARLLWCLRVVVFLVVFVGSVGAASAYDCYLARQGTKLYIEPTLQTSGAALTGDAVGWFGRRLRGEQGLWLRFVELDGERLLVELDAYVSPADVSAIACPRELWSRPTGSLRDLTWPDGRQAGAMMPGVIEQRRVGVKVEGGRACFAAGIPAITRSVCALDDATVAASEQCLLLPPRTKLFARPSLKSSIGKTSARVYARGAMQVGKLQRASLFDLGGRQFDTYFSSKGARPVKCPAVRGETELSVIEPYEALFPDGTSAGLRIGGAGLLVEEKKKRVGSEVLLCRDEEVLEGVTLRLCYRAL